jgi:hypothetical protein
MKPAAIDMVCINCGDDIAKKTQQIPLPHDITCARIYYMSNGINQQVITIIKTSRQFCFQLDKITDVSDDVQLLAYVRYPGLKLSNNNVCFVGY